MSEISLQSDDTFVKSIDNSISNVKSSTSTVTTTAESDKSTKKVPQNTFNIWGDAKQLPKLSHSNKVKLKIRKETHDIATTMLKKHKDTLEKTQFIVEEIKKIIETSEPENQINEFIHKEFDEEPLKGLTLCNDPDKIINDIEKSHKFYNNYGYFFNKEGKRIKLYLQTNFGGL